MSAFPTPPPARWREWLLARVPRGNTLPDAEWSARHRTMLWILWAHVVALPVFLILQGFGPWPTVRAIVPLLACGMVARGESLGRRARSVAVVLGLLTASAVLVYGWHGQIEAHFHFFVMIALLALYEDWLPFGLAVAYVALEHGVLGALVPHAVYNHGGSPWLWALAHGVFVLGAAAAAVATWRLNEDTRLRLNQALDEATLTGERFRIAFESGISGMAIVGAGRRFLRVNRALCEMLGYSEAELLSLTYTDVTHPDDQEDVEQLRALLAGEIELYQVEKRYRHRDGNIVWVQLGSRVVRNDEHEFQYFLTQVINITKRKRFEAKLAHDSLHDPLTGMPNRLLFMDRLELGLVRLQRQPGQLSVLFVDLDRFKLVNDTMGHETGDAVLVEAAARLRGAVRQGDTVSRFGGDEFTILCEQADEQQALWVAERVLKVLEEPFHHGGREFRLSASVGVRVDAEGGISADDLLRDADVALYTAKRHGRGRFAVFGREARRLGYDPLATEHDLRRALERRELRLHYQPEVDLATGRIIAVEALVRWEHPERGLVPPSEFIPVAEETGLVIPLGSWVLEESCRQLAAWRAAGVAPAGLRIAVNVSARQLSQPGLCDTVRAALSASGVEPEALVLEITETALLDDPDMALRSLEEIGHLGAHVALDDFGVGFSTLSRVRDLPAVDVIKIDRSFVSGSGDGAADAAVVGAVLSLSARLGVTTVAEGIESDSQLRALREMGCSVGQGYLLARPQPPEQIAALLKGESPLGGSPQQAQPAGA